MDPGRRSWWRRPGRVVAVGILLLASFGVVGFWGASKTGLKRELAAIRAQGLPTNPAELDKWYSAVPTEENTGLKFLDAYGEFVEAGEGRDPGQISWSEIAHDQRLDAKTMAALRFHLERNSKTLGMMREAAKLKRSRFPVDLSPAPDISFSHQVPAKRLAQLARWEAVYQAERGDAAAALEALRCGFAVSRTLGQEPLLFTELVRLACVALQISGMERVINVVSFDERQLLELSAMVREAAEESRTALHRAFIGERAFANSGRKYSFEEYEQMARVGALIGVAVFGGRGSVNRGSPIDKWPEFLRKVIYHAGRGIGMQDRDHAFFMRSMGRLIDATALEHPNFFRESEAVSAELSGELNENPLALALSRMALASMFGVARREVLVIARLRCVEAALEIERWRRKHEGALPKETELVGELFDRLPADPFDGRPLKFEALSTGGYRVMAVEASGREAQGASLVSGKAQKVAFEVMK